MVDIKAYFKSIMVMASSLVVLGSAYAELSPISQAPYAITDPSSLIPTGNQNGLSPNNPYQEYIAGGAPWRYPIAFEQPPCDNNNACHYPTNKWYTDLLYQTKGMDNFRAAQYPFYLRIFDNVQTNSSGDIVDLPGLGFTTSKTPYMQVENKPSEHGLATNIHPFTLAIDPGIDMGFGIPADFIQNDDITRTISAHDQLSITMKWTVNGGQSSMTAPIVQGSPYMTMQYDNMPFNVYESTNPGFLAIAADTQAPSETADGQTVTGRVFRVIVATSDFSKLNQRNYPDNAAPILYNEYMIFLNKPTTLRYEANKENHIYQELTSTAPFTGIARVAYVGAVESTSHVPSKQKAVEILKNNTFAQQEKLLKRHANTYPVSGEITLASSDTLGEVTYTWETQTMDTNEPHDDTDPDAKAKKGLLMMAFTATQTPLLKNTPLNHRYTIQTLRGPMQAALGKRWRLRLPLPTTLRSAHLWQGNKPINPKLKSELQAALTKDVSQLEGELKPTASNDTYGFGKQIARFARLALIADALGDTGARDTIVKTMIQYTNPWLKKQAPNDDPHGIKQGFFKYDNKFGGILSARAASAPDSCDGCGYNQDFFNGQYTDHHFHYGYFLYAAAVIAKFDPAWKAANAPHITLLARDIANPSLDDPYITAYRHFDWFEGHAYANGLGPNASGRNQESTSEAVNAWYALSLWGDVIGNDNMRDIGRIMSALEIHTAQAWTQINPATSIYKDFSVAPNTHFNPFNQRVEMKSAGATSINWALKIHHATYFGNVRHFILGIQILPYTPITDDLLGSGWVRSNWELLNDSVQHSLDIMQAYSDLSNGPHNIVSKFTEEWNQQGNFSDYWNYFFASYLNNYNYRWLYLVAPIMAVHDADAAYALLDFESGQVPTAMAAVNEAFRNSERVKFGEACQARGEMTPPACITDDFGDEQPIYTPKLALTSKDNNIDNGETVTNVLWWLAIQGANANR